MRNTFCLLLTLISISASATATDWSRFRGSDGQGIASESVPVKWSSDEGILWKTDLPGAGSSSPVVVGNRIFVTCYEGTTETDAKRSLVCVDSESGKIQWTKSVDAPVREDSYSGFLQEHGYASGSAVSDGTNVYAFFGKAGVLACTVEGKQLWQKNVGQMSSNRRWGSGASLILAGDILIVNASEEARSIIGLNKDTGEEAWKAEYDALELCFATPVLVPGEGGKMEAVISMPGEVWGLNPENGKLRWYCEIDNGGNVSPSVVVGEKSFFTFGGYPQQQTNAIKRGGRGDLTETHRLWNNRDSSYVATPLLHDGHLYWVSDRGQSFCVNAETGETVTRARLSGLVSGGRPVYASPVKAGDKIYVVTRRSGTFVYDAKPEMPEVARNPALDDSDFNATPAVTNGRLILRSNKALYAIGS